MGSDTTGTLATLTARMVRQDEDAFAEFLALYQDRLFRYAIVLVRGDEHAAKEALQHTMIKVVKHIRRFDDENMFWSWLTRIIRNVVIDDSRKHGRYQTFLSRWFGHRKHETESIDSEHDETNLLKQLEAVLPLLPSEDADLIRRKYYEGDTIREIASHLSTTEKAIESRLVRIRRRLREIILKQKDAHE